MKKKTITDAYSIALLVHKSEGKRFTGPLLPNQNSKEIRQLPPDLYGILLKKVVKGMATQSFLREQLGLNLTSLDLSHNNLVKLPRAMRYFNSLSSLTVSYNNLTTLPSDSIGYLFLASLDLSHNNLQHIPSDILRIKGLLSLNLSFNSISAVQSEFSDSFFSLEHLDLRHNRIESFITPIPSLVSLLLSGNPIHVLPHTFVEMQHLETFSFDASNIPKEILAQHPREIRSYLEDLQRDSEKCYRMKLLVVGDAHVGKVHDARPFHLSKLSIDECYSMLATG